MDFMTLITRGLSQLRQLITFILNCPFPLLPNFSIFQVLVGSFIIVLAIKFLWRLIE